MKGATRLKVKTEAESYSEAGQRLTRVALRSIPSGCCCCETKTEELFLLHFSLSSSQGTMSLMLCHKCAGQLTVKGLINMVAETVSESPAACYQ